MERKNFTLHVLIIFTLLSLSLIICSCSLETGEKPISVDVDYPEKFGVLTQNAMLIPFSPVAPFYRQRAFELSEFLYNSDFNITGLQEIFWDRSQVMIINKWYESLKDADSENFLSKYSDIQGSLKDAGNVSELSLEKNPLGIEIIDARPAGNTKTAKIAFGPYHVLGPDTDSVNFLKQDSGLLILSRFPVIAAGAFSFSNLSGTDRLANKGVLYARIKIGKGDNDYIHFFNTHLQSHQWPDTRLKNLEEMLGFASNILLPELSNKGYINPVIMVGDFNVSADLPADWAEKSGIIHNAGNNQLMGSFEKSGELEEFMQLFYSFSTEIAESGFSIKDTWQEIYPQEPGFTWIGKDWELTDNNPYGKNGNRVAAEKGPPQRIDYIFYFGGSGSINIIPEKISLYPESPSTSQLSDHLGLQSFFNIR